MAAKRPQSQKKPRKQVDDGTPARSGGRLSGKFAVVTGGNRGLGLAIARALVGEGCSVLITGRDEKALSSAKKELKSISVGGADVLAEECEVRDPESVYWVFNLVKK